MQEIIKDLGDVKVRRACVVHTQKGYRVDLYEKMSFIRSVDLKEYNKLYAESLAEIWINNLIKE